MHDAPSLGTKCGVLTVILYCFELMRMGNRASALIYPADALQPL